MKKCACCNSIGGHDMWFVRLCDDCKKHTELSSEFEWYRMMIHMRTITLFFLWALPILAFTPFLTHGNFLLEWWCWPIQLVSWIFVFRNYRQQDWPKTIAAQREKLWLLKMSE